MTDIPQSVSGLFYTIAFSLTLVGRSRGGGCARSRHVRLKPRFHRFAGIAGSSNRGPATTVWGKTRLAGSWKAFEIEPIGLVNFALLN